MIPFVSQLYYFPAVPAAGIVEVPVPSNLFVQQLTIAGSGAFSATVYRRNFTYPQRLVSTIASSADGILVTFTRPHHFRVGDWVRVANNANGYDGVHEVLYGPSSRSLVLNKAYGVASTSGDVTLVRHGLQAVSNGAGKVRIYFKGNPAGPTAHMLSEGDTIAVSGSSVGGYNVNHIVTAVDIDANTVDTSVAYTADVTVPFLVELATAAEQKPVLELFPLTAHTANVVRLTDTFGRPVSLSTQRRTCVAEERICVLFTAGGALDYHICVAGHVPGIG